MPRIAGRTAAARGLAAELTDACVGLALGYARRDDVAPAAADSLDLVAGLDPDAACLVLERLATEGHNLHPCGRTRLGWSVPDLLAYDLESTGVPLGFVGIRRDLHVGDDLSFPEGPDFYDGPLDRSRYAVSPIHPWQRDRVLPARYADLVADGGIVELDSTLAARPTAALRTLLLSDGRYVKVSLDILVTSTRRSISVASTRNAVPISTLLAELVSGSAAGDRVILMAETAGSAGVTSGGRDRDLAAIVRNGLSGRLGAGEVPVPGTALCAVSPVTGQSIVAELVERFARTRGLAGRPAVSDSSRSTAACSSLPRSASPSRVSAWRRTYRTACRPSSTACRTGSHCATSPGYGSTFPGCAGHRRSGRDRSSWPPILTRCGRRWPTPPCRRTWARSLSG